MPTGENPSDIGTRPISASEFAERSDLWFRGPPWLRQDRKNFPSQEKKIGAQDVSERDLELRRIIPLPEKALMTLEPAHSEKPDKVTLLNKYSSLLKLQKVTVYCFRFIRKIKINWEPIRAPHSEGRPESKDLFLTDLPKRGNSKVLREIEKSQLYT